MGCRCRRHEGDNAIKLFFFVTGQNKLVCFSPASFFQANLIFVNNASASRMGLSSKHFGLLSMIGCRQNSSLAYSVPMSVTKKKKFFLTSTPDHSSGLRHDRKKGLSKDS